jgi:hypothetical protein
MQFYKLDKTQTSAVSVKDRLSDSGNFDCLKKNPLFITRIYLPEIMAELMKQA